MINPLHLGQRTFPINLIQGPLAGVSCAPFRRLTTRYSQPAFTCTEMISVKTLLHQQAGAKKRYVAKDPGEGPVCFQLSGNDPAELGEAVKIAENHGADLIDLNCGCPVNKIRKKGAGSSLLMNPARLYQLITAMKTNTRLPVSIKIRVEGGSSERFHAEVAAAVRDAGADFLVVHGRHWSEHYETPVHYRDIQFFVENLNIPVIGNGDVACVRSLKSMFGTGCAGVMIGRAGVGQPWLIQQLSKEIQGMPFKPPPLTEIGQLFIEHAERLVSLLGNEKFAMLSARKLAKYYARGLPAKTAFCDRINACETLADFTAYCTQYFI